MADVNFRALGEARFPTYKGDINVNMMPFLMGIEASIPTELLGYAEMALACTGREEFGKVGYLTVHESFQDGSPQRRPGLHTEGFGDLSWGGGSWGGYGGLFLAKSLPDSCAIYDAFVRDTDFGGAVPEEAVRNAPRHLMEANRIYWMHDRTPHESLSFSGKRQFFRLVTNDVSVWFADHSTPSPFGIQPQARVIHGNKFKMEALQ